MFKSFFLGGFECATGYNREGLWIDLIDDTAHQLHADEDYRRLRDVGIETVRDGIRWPLVDRGNGQFDFSSVVPLLTAARKHEIEVVWDLFHYGYPRDIDLLSNRFIERFADYCAACARFLRARSDQPLWFTPINEPSYFAWAAGEAGHFAPYLTNSCRKLKMALVQATLRGIDAIRAEVPDARFLHADPVCRVVPSSTDPAAVAAAHHFNQEVVFESWDVLCGLRHPELGGSRANLDVVGINYYWNCQWEHGADGTWLDDDDPRRLPLRDLVVDVWKRYGGELAIAETSHWGDRRANWMRQLAGEVEAILDAGGPLSGVCLYPIIEMRDWHHPRDWMPMGLWDIDCSNGMRRIAHEPMLDVFLQTQRRLEIHLACGEQEVGLMPNVWLG